MIELIDLRKWKKQKQIILELHREWGINIDSRRWRLEVEKWNKRWANQEVEYCITHSNQYGFKATSDYEEAKMAINDFRSRRRKMYEREKDILDGFINRKSYKIDLESGDLI